MNVKNFIKSKLPAKLFDRFVLIVLLPMFLMQSISLYIFFHRYLSRTVKQNIDIFKTEIFILNDTFEKNIQLENDYNVIIKNLNLFDNIKINFKKNSKILKVKAKYKDNIYNIFYKNLIKQLKNELSNLNIGKINLYKLNENNFNLEVEKDEGILVFTFNKNRIFVQRIYLIVFWNILTFIIMGSIALVYIKNQVKSIIKLKDFANEFSYLEKDNTNFKAGGAKEIRETGIAFLNMVKKMKSLINTRTTMLAQISHDLRTPLTRMKLQTEFLDDKTIADFFKKDLEEMEKLIKEYLLFAKGENENDFKKIKIKTFFENILEDYNRSGYKNIKISYSIKVEDVYLKFDSFRRCINNLINNAIKYAKNKIEVFVKTTQNVITVIIEDDGNGIEENLFEKMQLIFCKNEKTNTDGFGLGLFIVKNIVNMHKGKIYFSKSERLGGLKIKLKIPTLKNN